MVIKRNTGIASRVSDSEERDQLEPKLNALVATVLYADLFDYALTRDELHRYLIGARASRADIDQILDAPISPYPLIDTHNDYVTMHGRKDLVDVRQRRAQSSARLWQQALAYRSILARLPFIRMIAVTGTLAMDNTEPDGDIDLFVVTTPGRLWLTRAFVIGVVKLAALTGIALCPNYLITERVMEIADKNIFTAHELAQMVPILGRTTYTQMMDCNRWMLDYLPNTIQNTTRISPKIESTGSAKRTAETLFNSPAGSRLETWEMHRKSQKLSRRKTDAGRQGTEADFSPDWCKGHFEGHGERTLHEFYDRLEAMGINGVISHGA